MRHHQLTTFCLFEHAYNSKKQLPYDLLQSTLTLPFTRKSNVLDYGVHQVEIIYRNAKSCCGWELKQPILPQL